MDKQESFALAAKNGHLNTVKYLVKHGANVTALSNYAIRWAALNGHKDVVRYIRKTTIWAAYKDAVKYLENILTKCKHYAIIYRICFGDK